MKEALYQYFEALRDRGGLHGRAEETNEMSFIFKSFLFC